MSHDLQCFRRPTLARASTRAVCSGAPGILLSLLAASLLAPVSTSAQGEYPFYFSVNDINGINGFKMNGVDARRYTGGSGGYSMHSATGESVDVAGDVNGDGLDDLIVGAPSASPDGRTGAGQAFVVFGRNGPFPVELDLADLDGTDGFALNGVLEGDHAGAAVAGVGDVNGDGFDDVLVGAPDALPNDDGTNQGIAYLVFGRSPPVPASIELNDLDGSTGTALIGFETELSDVPGYFAGIEAGAKAARAGDINDDGLPDFLINAPQTSYSLEYAYQGAAFLIYGNDTPGDWPATLALETLDATRGFRLIRSPIIQREELGSGLSGSDINGDGIDDILLGATGAGPDDQGEAFVVFGNATPGYFGSEFDVSTLDGSNGFSVFGAEPGDEVGSAVAGADFTGDGINELVVGALRAPKLPPGPGSLYLVEGRSTGFPATKWLDNGSLAPDAVVYAGLYYEGEGIGEARAGRLGGSLQTIGDLNGDGFDDVIAGLPGASGDPFLSGSTVPPPHREPVDGRGQALVLFGRPDPFLPDLSVRFLWDLQPGEGFWIDGETRYGSLGKSVAGGGDFNGDGAPDLVVGQPENGKNFTGSAYVVFGKPAPFFADDFESGDVSGWSSEYPPGALAVDAASAYEGGFGLTVTPGACTAADGRDLEIDMAGGDFSGSYTVCNTIEAGQARVAGATDLTAGSRIALQEGFTVASGQTFAARIDSALTQFAYVQDDSPADERTYNAELYVDLQDLLGGFAYGYELDLFSGYSSGGDLQFRVTLSLDGIRVAARQNDGSYVEGSDTPVPGTGWFHLNLAFAARPGDGVVTVSIDGGSPSGPTTLTNDLARIDYVRLGAVSGLLRSCLVKPHRHLASVIRNIAIRTMFSAVRLRIS